MKAGEGCSSLVEARGGPKGGRARSESINHFNCYQNFESAEDWQPERRDNSAEFLLRFKWRLTRAGSAPGLGVSRFVCSAAGRLAAA